MKIPYVSLDKQYKNERKDLIKIFDNVLRSGTYVGGEFVKKFEENLAKPVLDNLVTWSVKKGYYKTLLDLFKHMERE